MAVNIRDVARVAKVSPSTVSRVINDTVPVSEEIRSRVMDAIAQLHYSYRPQAVVQNGQLHTGIVLPRRSVDDFSVHPTLYNGFVSFAEEMNRRGILSTLVIIDSASPERLQPLFAPRLDGYFILGIDEESENIILDLLTESKTPHVIGNRWLEDRQTSFVNIDDCAASRNATEHLIRQGYRKIAFVCGDKNYRNSIIRQKGFLMAMRGAELPVPDAYMQFGEYDEVHGYHAANQLFSLREPPEAAFFASDNLAIGAQKYCREHGIRLPEDFAMVGYGDIALATYVHPQLTTVRLPSSEIGRQAAMILANMMENDSVVSMQLLLNAPLIVRDSCGSKSRTDTTAKGS